MATKRVLIKEESEKAKKKRPEVKIEYEVKKIKPPPARWEETWDKLVEMRAQGGAPVDEMGAESLAENVTPEVHAYQTLIGLMLSSQTRDQMTDKAMGILKKHGLTVENIMKTSEEDIRPMINCVSFYNRKAIYIKKTTEIIATKYNGVPPKTLEETLEFPGVGPKMAHLYLQIAHGVVKGIGVDTHVHRISNRLRWVKTDTAEDTRKQLEEWLPFERWTQINKMLVGFGQTICRPVGPKCDQCLLSNGLCPSARQFLPQARARTAAAVKKEEEGEEKEAGESTTVKTESHEIEAPAAVPNAPEVVKVKKEEGAEGPPAPSASSSPARTARRGRRELA